jgi:hypothetical protein
MAWLVMITANTFHFLLKTDIDPPSASVDPTFQPQEDLPSLFDVTSSCPGSYLLGLAQSSRYTPRADPKKATPSCRIKGIGMAAPKARGWWLMPVILATQEAEIRMIWFEAQANSS